jgi:MFS family permease
MLARNFHEQVERSKPRIDYRGATLLTAGLALVILAVLEGGQAWAWDSPASIAVFTIGAVLLAGFWVVELRAPEPVLPLWVFRRRLLVASSLIAAGVGAILLGLTSYVPTYVQEVLGHGPVVAGFALATLSMGWPLAASQAGKVYMRIGFRNCTLIGTTVIVLSTALLLLFGEHTSVWQVAATCLVIGVGMGLTASPTLIAAQSSVGWRERGVVTANNLFLRSLGSALGIAAFGALANAVVGRTDTTGGRVDPTALTSAVQHIFLAVVVIAVLMLVTAVALPRQPLPERG